MGGLDRMVATYRDTGTATGNPDADALLRSDGNAVLVGVLLDQQMRAEVAFSGPYKLKQRLGHLDLRRIAAMDGDAFRAVFTQKPSLHRFGNMMADRVRALAEAIAETWDGDAANIWRGTPNLSEIERRFATLPGFGANKAKMARDVLELFGHRTFPDTST